VETSHEEWQIKEALDIYRFYLRRFPAGENSGDHTNEEKCKKIGEEITGILRLKHRALKFCR